MGYKLFIHKIPQAVQVVESAVAFALPTIQGATQAELQAVAGCRCRGLGSPGFHGFGREKVEKMWKKRWKLDGTLGKMVKIEWIF